MSICLITLNLYISNYSRENDMPRRIEILSALLESQTSSLVDLCVGVSFDPPIPSVRLPILLALKNLTIEIKYAVPLNSRPILPFAGNPFPALQKLHINRYRGDYRVFGSCSMPSVQELHLHHLLSALTDPAWKPAFPNLTTLHITVQCDKEKILRSTLVYILTRFTRLVHLKLELTRIGASLPREPKVNFNYWDILTGQAPTSVISDLATWKLVSDAEAQEEPANGIYEVPSLRNMRGKN